MNYFKILTLSVLFNTLSLTLAWAQVHELGFMGGAANYRGELAPNVNLSDPGVFAGIFYRANVSPALSLRFNLNYGQIQASDFDSETAIAQARRHEFTTALWEFSGQFEYNFLDFRGRRNSGSQYWTPYFFAGFGAFKMEPLQNNQASYTTLQALIPMGVGFKAEIGEFWNLGFEIGTRFTFTDYLDDLGLERSSNPISSLNPRFAEGNPNDKDLYFFSGISLSYVFPFKGKDCPVTLPR